MNEVKIEEVDKELEKLKNEIAKEFNKIKNQDKLNQNNIYRGHIPSISAVVEDEIALFLKNISGKKFDEFYIDYTIKGTRPDILIVKNREVKYIIEIKSNIGYCRDMKKTNYIEKLVERRKTFQENKEIKIRGSKEIKIQGILPDKTIKGNVNAKMIVIVLTSDNTKEEDHIENKDNLAAEDIGYYVLFKGWYNSLEKIKWSNDSFALAKYIMQ